MVGSGALTAPSDARADTPDGTPGARGTLGILATAPVRPDERPSAPT